MEDYQIKNGILEKQIDQLIEFSSTDDEVRKFTSDPIRFRDSRAFEEWRKKGKTIYTLVDNMENLVGIIWFSRESLEGLENYDFTFAIRIYGEARGKGLAKTFMEEAFRRFGEKGVWLQTSADNIAAVKAYEKFGFKKTGGVDDKGKIKMILVRA